jgi:hypothetical protein
MNKSNIRIKGEEANRLRFQPLDLIYQECETSGIIEPTDENPNDVSFIPIFKHLSRPIPISSETLTHIWIPVPLTREELDKIQRNSKTDRFQLCIDSPLFEWSQAN